MLRTAQQLRNVITVFHNPALKASQTFVQKVERRFQDSLHNYDLQIERKDPTPDQLRILKTLTPLLAGVAEPKDLPRPTLVSWFNGKVAVQNEERANAILNVAEETSEK